MDIRHKYRHIIFTLTSLLLSWTADNVFIYYGLKKKTEIIFDSPPLTEEGEW